MTYHACPKCKAIVPRFQHLHESAHGGAHIAGTERYVCPACDYELPPAQAVALGLLYAFDREKNPKLVYKPDAVTTARIPDGAVVGGVYSADAFHDWEK